LRNTITGGRWWVEGKRKKGVPRVESVAIRRAVRAVRLMAKDQFLERIVRKSTNITRRRETGVGNKADNIPKNYRLNSTYYNPSPESPLVS
jgi:hypothetical protein